MKVVVREGLGEAARVGGYATAAYAHGGSGKYGNNHGG